MRVTIWQVKCSGVDEKHECKHLVLSRLTLRQFFHRYGMKNTMTLGPKMTLKYVPEDDELVFHLLPCISCDLQGHCLLSERKVKLEY